MATSIQCLKFSFYINVSFDDKKDPGVGANQNIYKEAQKNSPGYDMYNDGQGRDIFIKMNGSELQGQVNFQFVSNKVIKYSSKFWKISLPPPPPPQKKIVKKPKSYCTGLAWSYSFPRFYQLEEHYGILEVLDSVLYAKRNNTRRWTMDCKSTQCTFCLFALFWYFWILNLIWIINQFI